MRRWWMVLAIIFLMPVSRAAAAFNVNLTKPDIANTVQFSSVDQIVINVINFIIVIAGIIFVVLFFVGAIRYLTGAGDEKQTQAAKRLLVDAIVGLILVLAAWAIATFIYKSLTKGTTAKISPPTKGLGGATIQNTPNATPSGNLPPIITIPALPTPVEGGIGSHTLTPTPTLTKPSSSFPTPAKVGTGSQKSPAPTTSPTPTGSPPLGHFPGP